MSTYQEQISTLRGQISSLTALVNGTRYQGKLYAFVGSHAVFGCKVTSGISDSDFYFGIEGRNASDIQHWNPDFQAPATNYEHYGNIANIYGEAFFMPDQNTVSLNNLGLQVESPPSVGWGRYDVVYAYVNEAGPSIGVAKGTASTAAFINFNSSGLIASGYKEPQSGYNFDPILPRGVLPLARIYLQGGDTGLLPERIVDVRNFQGRLRGEKGEVGMTWRGTWNPALLYGHGDAVFYENVVYVSAAPNNVANSPALPENAPWWDKILSNSQGDAIAAANSASEALGYKNEALTSKVSAKASQDASEASRALSDTARIASETAETNAAASAAASLVSETNAASSATEASASEAAALAYKNTTYEYKLVAEAATVNAVAVNADKVAADASRDAAALSAVAALASELAAQASEDASLASQNAAANSQDAAAVSAAASELSASHSLASENAASASETAAAESELAAATSEGAAATSQAAASASQAAALASQNAAAASEVAASNSEAQALASKNAALVSELAALAYKNSAGNSQAAAAASEVAALASENAAAASEAAALGSKNAAAASEATALAHKNASSSSAAAAFASQQASSASEAAALASEGAAATSAAAAVSSQANALASELLASEWAEKTGAEVAPGQYSAKHWALTAAAASSGAMTYIGVWDASNGVYPPTPSNGYFYKISVAGTIEGVDFLPQDMILFNGTFWDKIDNTETDLQPTIDALRAEIRVAKALAILGL